MKLKTGLIFVLSLLILCVTLTACKKDETPPETDDGNDEFTGSIAPEDETGGKEEGGKEEEIDEGDPNATYEIFTAEDLKTKLKLKGTYVLKADIDLTGAEWKPLGTAKHPFSGTFNGGGFKISNFKVTEKPTQSEGDISLAFKYAYGGFFGVTENATVKDTVFDSINIDIFLNTDNTYIYAGAVAGYAKSTAFSGITVSNATVTAQSSEYITFTGGLIGGMQGSSAYSCTVNTAVTARESLNDAYAGGITAWSSESELSRCDSLGSVTSVAKYGKSYSGGLIGYCSSSTISKCVSASAVNATVSSSSAQTGQKGSASAGGFAAMVTASSYNKRSVISESYTTDTCTVTAVGNRNASYAGGFAASSEYGIYTHCYSRSNVSSESINDAVYAAGLIANLMNQKDAENPTPYPYDTRITGCFFMGNVTVKTGTQAYFIGTLAYSLTEIDTFIFSSGYYEKMKIYINNEAADNTNERIQKNGNEVSSTVYGNMTLLKDNYGWKTESWEIKSGESYPTLKAAN